MSSLCCYGGFPQLWIQVKTSKSRRRPRSVEKGGRKKKEFVESSSGAVGAEDVDDVRAILMDKHLGMTYDCTYGVIHYKIAAKINARNYPMFVHIEFYVFGLGV